MADLWSGVIALGGVLLGLAGAPLQEWVRYKLTKKQEQEKNFLTAIEEAYLLLDSLKETLGVCNQAIFFFIYQRSGVNMPKQEAPSDPSFGKKNFKKLMFILEFQLRMPDGIINKLKEFEKNIVFTMSILLHNTVTEVIKDTFNVEETAESLIPDIIKQYNNDPVAAASALRKKLGQDLEKLKVDIKKILLEKYPQYESIENNKTSCC